MCYLERNGFPHSHIHTHIQTSKHVHTFLPNVNNAKAEKKCIRWILYSVAHYHASSWLGNSFCFFFRFSDVRVCVCPFSSVLQVSTKGSALTHGEIIFLNSFVCIGKQTESNIIIATFHKKGYIKIDNIIRLKIKWIKVKSSRAKWILFFSHHDAVRFVMTFNKMMKAKKKKKIVREKFGFFQHVKTNKGPTGF